MDDLSPSNTCTVHCPDCGTLLFVGVTATVETYKPGFHTVNARAEEFPAHGCSGALPPEQAS